MHALQLLQKLTEKAFPEVHKKRSECLYEVVTSLIDCGKLWISALGRGIKNQTTAKHNIKKVDTLVGNEQLHQERELYYQFVARAFIGDKKRPIVIVDWSPISGDCQHYFLRASVTGKGRSMTIFEEVHELKYYANYEVHKNFLTKLTSILPLGCRPIVITDAGFRNTWFSLINQLNWDFIGRLRYNTFIKMSTDDNWDSVKRLHSQATSTPKHLGQVGVSRRNPIDTTMYLVLGKEKGRIKKTRHGIKCESSHSKKHSKSAREPWVLVTSLSHHHKAERKVMRLYQLRMQIEGSFKDIKNKRYGFRLPESGTKGVKRLANLVLFALLATVAVWLAGQVALNHKWNYQIQANTVRNTTVLSIAFIGIHVLRNLKFYKLKKIELLNALLLIQNDVLDWGSI